MLLRYKLLKEYLGNISVRRIRLSKGYTRVFEKFGNSFDYSKNLCSINKSGRNI